MRENDTPVFCDRCSKELVPGKGDFYVVRIEALADPSPPIIDEDYSDKDVRREIDRLVEDSRNLSEQELLDQVYRRTVSLPPVLRRVDRESGWLMPMRHEPAVTRSIDPLVNPQDYEDSPAVRRGCNSSHFIPKPRRLM